VTIASLRASGRHLVALLLALTRASGIALMDIESKNAVMQAIVE
jgi:hypothetical protein